MHYKNKISKVFTFLKITLICGLAFTCFSCDRPFCSTNNPVFLDNDFTSTIYKTELAHQIKKIGIENLRFWLEDYTEKNTQHYFTFYTQGPTLCAKAFIKVDTNKGFDSILKTKGEGYFNSEFRGLAFDVVIINMDQIEFQYTGHEFIID